MCIPMHTRETATVVIGALRWRSRRRHGEHNKKRVDARCRARLIHNALLVARAREYALELSCGPFITVGRPGTLMRFSRGHTVDQFVRGGTSATHVSPLRI